MNGETIYTTPVLRIFCTTPQKVVCGSFDTRHGTESFRREDEEDI